MTNEIELADHSLSTRDAEIAALDRLASLFAASIGQRLTYKELIA